MIIFNFDQFQFHQRTKLYHWINLKNLLTVLQIYRKIGKNAQKHEKFWNF